eukprot:CAMPEP_0171409224 /NCGR_PEP_ID=MMETSP0880-20121228/23936_1 /TAXON_ID=67004 /ORGANISM="Thalassiosira weissflogii, Strain CCMP1336" /LENGTH=75 /DNA_ID=CAMNT_0011925665 /DNA_START=75 /DNA_END=298 /DNA_ORIENTATION=-
MTSERGLGGGGGMSNMDGLRSTLFFATDGRRDDELSLVEETAEVPISLLLGMLENPSSTLNFPSKDIDSDILELS